MSYKKKHICKGGTNDNNKEIIDKAGDEVVSIAEKLNEKISEFSKKITTKELVDSIFGLVEQYINNLEKNTKYTINYFNNMAIYNSINILRFLTNQLKCKVEKMSQKMDQGKVIVIQKMDQYTKQVNKKIDIYSKKLEDSINNTINKANQIQQEVNIGLEQVKNNIPQTGNKKHKTSRKSKKRLNRDNSRILSDEQTK